ncbi:MAG: polysaccharide deacetylase family protein [Chitinophagaceae bacterium]|nr:polysaccharide deacetylase family protein [Chitinophagaceae bacterium]
MKPALFSRIIEYLVRKYTVVPLEHFLESPSSFKSAKELATVLFDDGYKDNIEFAVPILQKNQCSASFYIVTDCIDKNIPTWTYLIDNVLQTTRKKKIELEYDFVPEKLKSIQLQVSQGYGALAKEIKPWMKKLSNTNRLKIAESILSQCNDVQLPKNKMMNWDDIRQMGTDGFIIGSHSHTHPMLASLEDEKEIVDELRISALRIKQETGKIPLTISYPIGSFDERITRLAKPEGYKYGLAVEQRFYNYPSDNMAIPRVELYQEPWWKVQLHLKGNYWNRTRRIIR